ncbi:phosphotransferase family protein [Kribbella monticola]|uniref:phosphotransferase family protein n=1 Tax=Kribbella monticola TaxID=2185285 RepID=UPI0013006350|nr:phosphotransferase [Kribbella monticola]
MTVFVKRRELAAAGSIAEALDIFGSEIRFYREIAPVIGIRVPNCYRADETAEGTLLELEDLSAWTPGAAPEAAAYTLRLLHSRWEGEAVRRWPWLRPVGAAVDLVGRLYDETWPRLADLPPAVQVVGERLVGNVTAAERQLLDAGPLTLVHGDASAQNLRTSPTGEVALLDWEDVSAAPGILDLGWFLLSSVDPDDWPATIAAYGHDSGLHEVLPSLIVQGLLSLADHSPDSPEAEAWRHRLDAAAKRLES